MICGGRKGRRRRQQRTSYRRERGKRSEEIFVNHQEAEDLRGKEESVAGRCEGDFPAKRALRRKNATKCSNTGRSIGKCEEDESGTSPAPSVSEPLVGTALLLSLLSVERCPGASLLRNICYIIHSLLDFIK